MPVRLSGSPVLRWPDRGAVHRAALARAERVTAERDDIDAIGYVGSYARGDWGPGSDLDLVVVIRGGLPPIGERARHRDTASFPVPVDLLLYSTAEWRAHLERSPRWAQTVAEEAVWLTGGPPGLKGSTESGLGQARSSHAEPPP